jgi:hypothetical protein
MTSVKQCTRASYVEIYWFLSISTTDVTTCDATDAFCALVWPQPYCCYSVLLLLCYAVRRVVQYISPAKN